MGLGSVQPLDNNLAEKEPRGKRDEYTRAALQTKLTERISVEVLGLASEATACSVVMALPGSLTNS
jgi:hypothetical protein